MHFYPVFLSFDMDGMSQILKVCIYPINTGKQTACLELKKGVT